MAGVLSPLIASVSLAYLAPKARHYTLKYSMTWVGKMAMLYGGVATVWQLTFNGGFNTDEFSTFDLAGSLAATVIIRALYIRWF